MNEQSVMNRGQFVRELGLSSAALMAFYCLGSCSKTTDPQPVPSSTSTPTPTPTTPSSSGISGNSETAKGKINFTVDLNVAPNDKLKTEGEFSVYGDVFVALSKGKTYIALSKACTHEGTTVTYRLDSNDVFCPNHSSVFNNDGTVKKSPATKALTKYSIELSGNTLTIKE